jgi:hypothetical protein
MPAVERIAERVARFGMDAWALLEVEKRVSNH